MGKKLPVWPQGLGRLSLSTRKGMEFPAAFNKCKELSESPYFMHD